MASLFDLLTQGAPIADFLQNSSEIVLDNHTLSLPHVTALASALHEHKSITSLSLHNTQLNDQGLHTLIPILSQTPISTLNLSQNKLTDASVSVLAQETTSNHRLIAVDVAYNAVSASVIESIQAACQRNLQARSASPNTNTQAAAAVQTAGSSKPAAGPSAVDKVCRALLDKADEQEFKAQSLMAESAKQKLESKRFAEEERRAVSSIAEAKRLYAEALFKAAEEERKAKDALAEAAKQKADAKKYLEDEKKANLLMTKARKSKSDADKKALDEERKAALCVVEAQRFVAEADKKRSDDEKRRAEAEKKAELDKQKALAEKQAEEERRREAELQAAKDRDTAAALVTEAQRIRMEAEKKAIEEEKHAAHVLAQAKKLRQAAELKAEAERKAAANALEVEQKQHEKQSFSPSSTLRSSLKSPLNKSRP